MESISGFLARLSSYNLFNYLVPGGITLILAARLLLIDLLSGSIVVDLLLCYVTGMVISRVGSLLLAPTARLFSASRTRPNSYADFIAACRDDAHVETMLEAANTFRSLATAVLLLVIIDLLWLSPARRFFLSRPGEIACLVSVGALFIMSHRKQSRYVARRVEAFVERRVQGRSDKELLP